MKGLEYHEGRGGAGYQGHGCDHIALGTRKNDTISVLYTIESEINDTSLCPDLLALLCTQLWEFDSEGLMKRRDMSANGTPLLDLQSYQRVVRYSVKMDSFAASLPTACTLTT